MSGKILPLPESVRSRLRSGVAITSVAQCVEELVLNCLDAGATCIAVRVDLGIFRIQVVDNGSGIHRKNLDVLGNRHTTSKCHTLQDLTNNLTHYGFRGEALASIIELAAIIDITTRHQSAKETFTKLYTYGKEKSLSLADSQRPSVGTTITIQDFMYNMPVRRKLIKEAIDIESVRMRLESFALMHPGVSFSLRNDTNKAKIFQASKTNCLMSTFIQLFGSNRAQGLAEVHHSVDQFTISGYISTQPHTTKSLQFLYVNKRVLLKTKVHKFMNELLSKSSIISNRLHNTTPASGKTPSSPVKGLRLYGIFVLNVECPLSEYDICLDPRKTLVEFRDWDKLLLCIEEMVIKFINEEKLTISLDERYRRSGRDDVEEEDSPPPHSSQALLQIFSRKRPNEGKSTEGGPKEKYGRTLCLVDNLSAVHSLPARRTRNKTEKELHGKTSQENCNERTGNVPHEKTNKDDCNLQDDESKLDEDDKSHDDFVIKKKYTNASKSVTFSQDESGTSKDRKVISNQKCQSLIDKKKGQSLIDKKSENPDNKASKDDDSQAKESNGDLKNLSHIEYIRSILAKGKESTRCKDIEEENQPVDKRELEDKQLNDGNFQSDEEDGYSDASSGDMKDGLSSNPKNKEEDLYSDSSSSDANDDRATTHLKDDIFSDSSSSDLNDDSATTHLKDDDIFSDSDTPSDNDENSCDPHTGDQRNKSPLTLENDEVTKDSIAENENVCETTAEFGVRKSSLTELKELYEAEVKKIKDLELVSTPEDDLMITPLTPPAMKKVSQEYPDQSLCLESSIDVSLPKKDSLKSQSGQSLSRESSIDVSLSKMDSLKSRIDTGLPKLGSLKNNVNKSLPNKEINKEKRSLTSVLSEGMLKHQKKMEAVKTLQKFEFKRNSKNEKIKEGSTCKNNYKKLGNSHSDVKSVQTEGDLQGIKRSLVSHRDNKVSFSCNRKDPCNTSDNKRDSSNSNIHQSNKNPRLDQRKFGIGNVPNLQTDVVEKNIKNIKEKITDSLSNSSNIFNRRRDDINAKNLPSTSTDGLNVITVTAEVHKQPENSEGLLFTGESKTDFESSFRFDPVLTSKINDDSNDKEIADDDDFCIETENFGLDDNESNLYTAPVSRDNPINPGKYLTDFTDTVEYSVDLRNREAITKEPINSHRDPITYFPPDQHFTENYNLNYLSKRNTVLNPEDIDDSEIRCAVVSDVPLYSPPRDDDESLQLFKECQPLISSTQQFQVFSQAEPFDENSFFKSVERNVNADKQFIPRTQRFIPDLEGESGWNGRVASNVAHVDMPSVETDLASLPDRIVNCNESSTCNNRKFYESHSGHQIQSTAEGHIETTLHQIESASDNHRAALYHISESESIVDVSSNTSKISSGEIPAVNTFHHYDQGNSGQSLKETAKGIPLERKTSSVKVDNHLQNKLHSMPNFDLDPLSLSNLSTEAIVGSLSLMTENDACMSTCDSTENLKTSLPMSKISEVSDACLSSSNSTENFKSTMSRNGIPETNTLKSLPTTNRIPEANIMKSLPSEVNIIDDMVNKNSPTPVTSDAQNSPSLHFSQLTLPSFRDDQSTQSTDTYATCPLMSLGTPVISGFSSFTRHNKKEEDMLDFIIPSEICSESGNDNTALGSILPTEISSGNVAKHDEVQKIDEISNKADNVNSQHLSDSVVMNGNTESIIEFVSPMKSESHMVTNNDKSNEPNGANAMSNLESCTSNTSSMNAHHEDATSNHSSASKIADGWKESVDANGKVIYVNLRTGNTSYDPPVINAMPEWNSSQPLGGPLLKVPLTHEPDYVPFGKYYPRQDFTLTHGFSAFMSWKKKREAERKAEGPCNSISKSVLGERKNPSYLSLLEKEKETTSVPEDTEIRYDDALLSPIPQETLEAMLKDFEEENESVKWINKPDLEQGNEPSNELPSEPTSEPSDVSRICQMWEAPSFAMDADVLQTEASTSGAGEGTSRNKEGPIRVYNFVHPYKFTREMLLSCKVLGQLDNKFIACTILYDSKDEATPTPNKLLVIFDQHAVHERIRLENIIEENYEVAESGRRVIKSSLVTPPLSLTLPDNEVRLMVAYDDYFIQRGLHFSKVSTSNVSFHAIPNCLVAKGASEQRHRRNNTASAIVESIVREMCHMLHVTGGVVGTIPKSLLYIMNSQACRGAIKFGDKLTIAECQELITSLSSCRLPFQCAHGRPSIVPLVNFTHLAKLRKNDEKPNIKKLLANMHQEENS